MADNETVIYYDEIAKGYNNLHKNEQINKFRELKKIIKIKKNMSMLDVGCGTCLSYDFFNCDVFGIEPSKKMVAQHPNFQEWVDRKKLFIAPAEQIAIHFGNKHFDIIICITVAHHFTDMKKVFEGIIEVSKPETVIAFSLLKRPTSFSHIKAKISEYFSIIDEIDEGKDIILLCKVPARA